MFNTQETQLKRIKELAEGIVLAEEQIERLEKETVSKKEALIALMRQAGQTAVKLDSGLCPRLETKVRISKNRDIENEAMFAWLAENGLGDIIRPAVHPGTLQTALEGFIAGGNPLPETVFSQFEQTVVRFNGRTNFLSSYQQSAPSNQLNAKD
jgi:hypothetical protein